MKEMLGMKGQSRGSRVVVAFCGILLHLLSAGAEVRRAPAPAFVVGVAPISRLRGGGLPQFWVNRDELKAAPDRWKAGFAKLRAMCEGGGGASTDSEALKGCRLTGKWTKVETVGQEKAMLMLGLNVVFRKAAILLSTVKIKSDKTAFEVTTKGAVVVSIKERYGFDGSVAACSRRDKRWGKHKGRIVKASEDKVVLDITWDDPHGGQLTETFEVDKSGDKMTQTSEIFVNEDATTGKKPTQSYTYYSVYKRVA